VTAQNFDIIMDKFYSQNQYYWKLYTEMDH